MKLRPATWPALIAVCLGLGACAVIPADDYGYYEDNRYYERDRYYDRETVIVTPPPRIEYRGLPPTMGYVWIDGYWNRVGPRPHWVPGYWSPPRLHSRPIVQPSPRNDARPDGRHDRRDQHDRSRWRDDDGPRDGPRWSGRDDVQRDGGRERDARSWPGFTPRRDAREGARPSRIVQERPPGARDGLLRTEPPRQRIERPTLGAPGPSRPELRPAGGGEVRAPRGSEAAMRPSEGVRPLRRDEQPETQRGMRPDAGDGGGRPQPRAREAAGN